MTEPPLSAAECPYAERDLVARDYLARRLSADEEAAFEEHWLACDRCWQRVRRAAELREAFAELESGDAEREAPAPRRRLADRLTPALAAAAVLTLVAVGLWVLPRIPDSPEPAPVFRGPDGGMAIELAWRADALEASWQPVAGAQAYLLRLFTADGELLDEWESGEAELVLPREAVARPEAAEPLLVQVEAYDGLRRRLGFSPLTPLPPPPAAPEPDPFAEAAALLDGRRYEAAAAAYAALEEEARAAGDAEALWRARLGWARTQDGLRRPEPAEEAFREAWELAGSDPRRQAETAYRRAMFLHRAGRLQEALEWAERCFASASVVEDPDTQSLGHGALANILSLAGRYREALAHGKRQVELLREARPGSRHLAVALNNLGIDYRHFGRFDEGFAVYEEALEIYRAHGDGDGEAMVLYNLANLHSATGDLERALELKLSSLALAERAGNLYGLGLLHNDLAELYRQAGSLAAARRHVELGLEINRGAGQVYGTVLGLEFLGRLELDESRPARAAELLREAVATADGSGYGKQQADGRSILARALAGQGRAREALAWAGEAVERARELGDPQVELEALRALAAAREAAGDPGGAAAAALEGIELLESWRGRLALGDLKMGVADLHWEVYEAAVRALMAEGRAEGAFAVAERARARLLLELMAGRAAVAAESEWEEVRDLLRELAAARRAARDASVQATLEREIAEVTGRLETLEEEARRARPARGAARHPRPAVLAEIQTGLLGTGRELLHFFWGEREVYGWRVSPAAVRGARLGESRELAPRLEFLRSALQDPVSGARWEAAARSLGERLLGPLGGPGEAGAVLVVADGPLALIPFEALSAPGEAGALGEERRIAYGPSASVLLALSESRPPELVERGLLAVGVSSVREGAGRVGPRALDPWPSLPFAAREAREIGRLFRGEGVDLLLGPAATRDRWLALDPGRYRYLHFAAHARAGDRGAEETYLLLADGRLGLETLRRLTLRAELATLSACDTGLGRQVRGEGIVGLSHAFLAAGARGVVVSLWRVEDRAAAAFMRELYRRLADGEPPAEAVRRARGALASASSSGEHPAHWAPFVLVGGLDGNAAPGSGTL